jgi:integrase
MLKQHEIAALQPGEKRIQRGLGDGLILVVEPDQKGGGKSFVGRMRIKQGGLIKDVPVRLGVFGTGPHQLTLRQAKDKWMEIKVWAKTHNQDPRVFGCSEKEHSEKTIMDAVEGFLASKDHLRPSTLTNYRRQLENQVLSVISPETPLSLLEWNRGGRQTVMALKASIEARESFDQAHRVQKVLSQCFDYAILQGWMRRDQNPAQLLKGEETRHIAKHHPTLTWDQVPKFLQKVSLNSCSGNIQVVLAVKFMLMSFLRAGCLVRLKWNWYDEDNEVIIVPGSTPGLKRTHKTDHIDHHIPVTKEMKALLSKAKALNGSEEFIFAPMRQSRYGHLDPESPNNYIKNLGYRNILRAHGWRSVPLTVGQESLKVSHEIIQRQMGHLIGDKVRKAYDNSLMLEERRNFLEKWCKLLVENGLAI